MFCCIDLTTTVWGIILIIFRWNLLFCMHHIIYVSNSKIVLLYSRLTRNRNSLPFHCQNVAAELRAVAELEVCLPANCTSHFTELLKKGYVCQPIMQVSSTCLQRRCTMEYFSILVWIIFVLAWRPISSVEEFWFSHHGQ
jgi:hypothetical protein